MHTPEQQAELIARAVAGDRRAFDTLMAPLMRQLHQQIYGYCARAEDREDAVQETLLRIWRFLPKFRGDSKFSTWCYTVARNRALTMITRHRRHADTLHTDDEVDYDEIIASNAADGEATLEGEQLRERLHAAIDALPPDLAQLFMLRELELLSYAEIAERTGRPLGTVKNRLHVARLMLGEMLGMQLAHSSAQEDADQEDEEPVAA